MPNIFGNLSVDEEVDHSKNERKARKKLKAINKLKKKESLTDEEQKKVDSEDYWQLILDPFYENKEKQREAKQRQREAEQRAEQREAEQRQREAKQREAKQRQREAEQRQREAEQRLEPKEFKTKNEKKIDIEFNLLLAKGNTLKKAKHNLLLKYHPDKNKGKSANEMTQIINNINIVNK